MKILFDKPVCVGSNDNIQIDVDLPIKTIDDVKVVFNHEKNVEKLEILLKKGKYENS